MLPNVYLSSSLKEEFGISIIEAMTAGFLIIAPRSGGVSSYIQNAENGFLIDTYTADEMKRGIESIFFLSEFTPGDLRSMA
jgi:glycosyltransferase involved in cell wall biosynthesis